MSCEKCGEVCGCPMEPPPTESNPDLAAADAMAVESQLPVAGEQTATEGDAWRGELSARLSRYRARRKAPPPRYPSLKLPFATVEFPARTGLAEKEMLAAFEPASNHALALDGSGDASVEAQFQSEEQPAPDSIPAPVQHSSAKIIEFPRFAWGPPPPPPDQLAEPVSDKLRILDVPDVAPPPPALGGITIEPVEQEEPEKRPGIDIPLQSADLGRRLVAAFIDGLLIVGAAALFGFIFWKVAAVRPPRIQLLSLAAGVLLAFWAAYQYLLIVYSGSTPGLRAAGLELTRFDGTLSSRSLRRWRVFASYLSALSLGMGYAWVFLDEDALCWHDRITHTYLAPRRREAKNDGRES